MMCVCPKCENGTIVVLVCPGAKWVTRECDYCHGTGQITDEQLSDIQAGKAMRDERLKRGISQSERAVELGMDWVAYSHLENGRPDKVKA